RRPRGSRDRLRPLRVGPLLERAAEEEGSPRLSSFRARRRAPRAPRGGPRDPRRAGRDGAAGRARRRRLTGRVALGPPPVTATAQPPAARAPRLAGYLFSPAAGAALTVRGGSHGTAEGPVRLAAGVAGGLLAAASYASSTLLARFAVPRYGALRVLLLEIAGGTLILGIVLPLAGHPPAPPPTLGGWVYIAALVLGPVLGANFLFFAGVRRIDAAPTAVAATIEPVVGALLALLLFDQHLRAL